MSNHTDNLVGRSVSASIGEPWDFESDAGKNRLNGVVIAVSGAADSVQWCLCTVSEFRKDGNPVRTVGIVDRYAVQDDLPQRLARGEKVGANFVYDAGGKDLTPEDLRSALASKSGLSFLAGSVQVVNDKPD
ncbi:MAG: hypothetical protein HY698_16990 [Deltaproteobacteria bacterium]|nr:hypothetical protein [Deltaproteobacteria bacterium]